MAHAGQGRPAQCVWAAVQYAGGPGVAQSSGPEAALLLRLSRDRRLGRQGRRRPPRARRPPVGGMVCVAGEPVPLGRDRVLRPLGHPRRRRLRDRRPRSGPREGRRLGDRPRGGDLAQVHPRRNRAVPRRRGPSPPMAAPAYRRARDLGRAGAELARLGAIDVPPADLWRIAIVDPPVDLPLPPRGVFAAPAGLGDAGCRRPGDPLPGRRWPGSWCSHGAGRTGSGRRRLRRWRS